MEVVHICNLYTTKASAAEVAAWFSARVASDMNAGPGSVFPKTPGMVVRLDGGERIVQSMIWGSATDRDGYLHDQAGEAAEA